MKKLSILLLVCIVVLAGYFFWYGPEHKKVEAHEAVVKAKIKRTNEAAVLDTKLVADWKQTLTTSPPDGNVDVAVYDSANGGIANYTNATAGTTYNTASIIKLSILETTLWQDQQQGLSGLTAAQLQQATPMIENSDNDAATDLWDMIGEQGAVQTFFNKIGATESTANEAWGLTQTTALDQLKVVNEVAYPGKLLTTNSANQANQLMDNIESDQRWGVTGGVPSGVSVELKNGWLADADNNGTSGWNINSIGHVHGDGVDYTIAVLTDDNNTEQDGINTIQALSTDAWNIVSALGKQPQ